jgi:hypothetical protein
MTPDFIKETEVLVDTAVLGKQIDEFCRSDVGRFLLENIDNEYNQGMSELKDVNPDEPKSVRAAQNKVWRAEQLRSWLKTAIHAGLKATEVLENREDEIY